MQLLNMSLESIFSKLKRRFSVQTVSLFALQALDRVNHCFVNDYLHRDIKPDNCNNYFSYSLY